MIAIDLRGLSVEQVIALVKQHQLGQSDDPAYADISDLYGNVSPYKKVICIWLNDAAARRFNGERRGIELPAKVTYTLWNGRKRQPRGGYDLHGFVQNNGTIDWGLGNTMNLMR